ncbi:MAG TPA: shikimate kinase [Allosphingosinicella sp.]|nr:shikimate kinase [Allosphingosinicella sp.]
MPEAPEPHKKSIALIGLMGAGKTSVGRRLAKRLSLPFADADAEIEAAAGLSIAEIFERFGEAHFRDGERRVIARLVDGPRQVIATGGGAFMDEETRALILARCTAIWLDGDLDTLAARLGRRDHRPLLRDKEPRALLAELAEARNPIYALAHFTVRGDAGTQERTVGRIVDLLGLA